jgi:hypothetical protein
MSVHLLLVFGFVFDPELYVSFLLGFSAPKIRFSPNLRLKFWMLFIEKGALKRLSPTK